MELRANSDGANLLFLESLAGISFSYSNMTSDYNLSGDKKTTEGTYIFLVNWMDMFLQYKSCEFYITRQSYAGHYVPQLAVTILANNKVTNETTIDLKGIVVGNAFFDDYSGDAFNTNTMGMHDFKWSHAMISDKTRSTIISNCKLPNRNITCAYVEAINKADDERGSFDIYNIYQPLIIHLDIKPQNILIDAGFNAKVSDFSQSGSTLSS